jgi:hypothetical protein
MQRRSEGENVFVICWLLAASWEINILTSVPKASTRAYNEWAGKHPAKERRNHPLLITPLTAVRVSIWDAERLVLWRRRRYSSLQMADAQQMN